MYLFVFTILLAVIFYVNGTKLVESKDQEIEALKEQLEEQNSGVDNVAETTLQEDTFSLVSNEEALISRNTAEEDNELVPYEGMNGPFRINKVKLLNHKWAIASFTDGSFWGDLLVSFEIDEEGKVEVFSEKALLYPQN
jgi:hypothetical protein